MKKIIIIGTGGHSDSVRETIKSSYKFKYKIVGFIDKFKEISKTNNILANDIHEDNCESFQKYYFIVAVGNNEIRHEWFKKLNKYNLKTINVIDKSATIANNAIIGTGNFIGKNVTITSHVKVGNNNIINSGSILEHGSIVENSINISPGAVICGDVLINDETWVCANSTVLGQLEIGTNVIIGAGSVVRKNILSNEVWVGNPAKLLKKNKSNND